MQMLIAFLITYFTAFFHLSAYSMDTDRNSSYEMENVIELPEISIKGLIDSLNDIAPAIKISKKANSSLEYMSLFISRYYIQKDKYTHEETLFDQGVIIKIFLGGLLYAMACDEENFERVDYGALAILEKLG